MLECPSLTREQRTVFATVIYTGLRQGEVAALRWSDVVDLQGTAPRLEISRSWETTTKTSKSRTVNLIPAAVAVLQAWRQHSAGAPSAFVWGQAYARGYDWGWFDPTDLTRGICWLGARRRAGIHRRVTFHHLRDTCASNLLTGTWGRAWTIADGRDAARSLDDLGDRTLRPRAARKDGGGCGRNLPRTCHAQFRRSRATT